MKNITTGGHRSRLRLSVNEKRKLFLVKNITSFGICIGIRARFRLIGLEENPVETDLEIKVRSNTSENCIKFSPFDVNGL